MSLEIPSLSGAAAALPEYGQLGGHLREGFGGLVGRQWPRRRWAMGGGGGGGAYLRSSSLMVDGKVG